MPWLRQLSSREFFALWLFATVMLASTSFAQVGVTNLGLAPTGLPQFQGELLAFTLNEAELGDLNGDGDTADQVLHMFDANTFVTTNLGLATSVFQIDGPWLAFAVPESAQGNTDLNGDGDAVDRVFHLFNATTGAITNLGLAGGFGHLRGESWVFSVNEALQGNTDLNGDGDTLDAVLHILHTVTGTIRNLGLAGTASIPPGEALLAFTVRESQQGDTDLNGDGDTEDSVLHLLELSAGVIINVGLAAENNNIQQIDNLVAFTVREDHQGHTDLNGDGDNGDRVLHLFDGTTSTTANLGFDGGTFRFEGSLLAFAVSEINNGNTDFNGDGDAVDSVLHLFDTSSATLTNLGVAGGIVASDGNLLAVGVSEFAQNRTDLNGDGDNGDPSGPIDDVLHLVDVAAGTITNVGLAMRGSAAFVEGNLLAFGVNEPRQGNADFNGDGDTSDESILHIFDAAAGTTANLGLDYLSSAGLFETREGWLGFLVDEYTQGNLDLNGDRDASDRVLHLFDSSTDTVTNLALAGIIDGIQGPLMAFRVRESSQGNTDLNGDRDAGDLVLHIADLDITVVPGIINKLRADVEALNLDPGLENSLTAQLDKAFARFSDSISNNDSAGISAVEDFIATVEREGGERISTEDATSLIATAQDILARLEGL